MEMQMSDENADTELEKPAPNTPTDTVEMTPEQIQDILASHEGDAVEERSGEGSTSAEGAALPG